MALKKTLAQRLFSMSRINIPALTNYRISSSSTAVNALSNPQPKLNKLALDPGDDGIFRRYLHRHSVAISPEIRSLPTGKKLLEKLRAMDMTRDRIRIEGLSPPAGEVPPSTNKKLTVEDVKKILRLSQLEMVKESLKHIENDYISYSDYLQICIKNCSSVHQGMEFAKKLDESGAVIVLGDFVLLRPEQEKVKQCFALRSLKTRW
ncbi:calcium uniporter protein 2, mitochondrial-like [Olea europaea var. sylvestris]|uniref:calcium uniporter protein 2, mitochondrial-like n=1 Tax=Olea europaea var. sylvestris TaxID=158386 RepID=UPI000C1CCD6D|nr:calcium uniporter protein 2, mitochondrial-like [Olea europaea var. sylvestris]